MPPAHDPHHPAAIPNRGPARGPAPIHGSAPADEHDGPDHAPGHTHPPGQTPGHAHNHAHSHAHAPTSFGGAFALGIALNGAFVIAEAVYGLLAHSLSLLADAGHNGGDVLGLAAAWLAAGLGRRRPRGRFTYGLRRSTILVALGNALVLVLATGAIAAEAVRRLFHPEPAAGLAIAAVAAAGILVNGVTAWLFAAGREHDLNRRAAFAHMAADALVALAVAVSGVLIHFTGRSWLDPVTSLLVGAVILFGTWTLLRDAAAYALDAVPPGIDPDAVAGFLRALPGVSGVHDLHIWGMSTTETALTVHLVRPGPAPNDAPDDALLRDAGETLRRRFNIAHSTIQIERGDACTLHPADTV